MSQIFDALQRSEAERLGSNLTELENATELLRAAERARGSLAAPAPKLPEIPTVPGLSGADSIAEMLPTLERSASPAQFPEFESLPVSIPPDGRLVCLTQKDSLAAEKFRFLGVRLRQMQQTRLLKKVLITSAIPHEGKSMVASNLACTLARRRQQKTLLIDGDLRRPTLGRQFGLGNVRGLSEWLQHEPGPIKNIYRLESAGLWILPAGTTPHNPLELMQAGALSSLMEQLAAQFDWIVIDSPPVLPLADTSVWARVADGIVLVARRCASEKKQLKKGLEALDHSKLLGTVINSSADVARSSNYYYNYGTNGSAE
ncbi:MAG TPA: CpsD/CapB family tyrosine-protein kinase [Terriglobales bacterium]